MECLVRVWQPPVTAAGLRDRPADGHHLRRADHHQVRRQRGSTRSTARPTSRSTTATNCPSRSQLAENKWAADIVMAHEFGHAAAGPDRAACSAVHASPRTAGRQGDRVATTCRRLETQADCFSGHVHPFGVGVAGDSAGRPGGHPGDLRRVRRRHPDRRPDVVGNHGLARSRLYWGTAASAPARSATATPSSRPGEPGALAGRLSQPQLAIGPTRRPTARRLAPCASGLRSLSGAPAGQSARRRRSGTRSPDRLTGPPRQRPASADSPAPRQRSAWLAPARGDRPLVAGPRSRSC